MATEEKIDLTLAEIFGMRQSIIEFNKIDLPIDVAYKFGKIVKAVQEELNTIEEQRVKLIKKYTEQKEVEETDDKGKKKKVTKDVVNEEKFYAEFNKFLKEEEVSLKVKKIKTSALRDTKISTNIITSLTPFFKSDDE